MTLTEIAELYMGLKSAFDYLREKGCKAERLIILLDARVLIQEELVAQMFGEG